MGHYETATLRFDGACQPNPGEGGSGYVLTDEYGSRILSGQHYIGDECTSNVAEYFGLIEGLKALRDSGHYVGHLNIEGDSELVIKQLQNHYSVRSNRLRPLHNRAKHHLKTQTGFGSYSISWIDRCYNDDADSLARDAIREKQSYSSDEETKPVYGFSGYYEAY